MYSDRNFNIREKFIAKPEPEYPDSVLEPDLVEEFSEILDVFLAVRPGPIGWVGWAVLTLMGVLLAAALIIGILQNQAGIACPR